MGLFAISVESMAEESGPGAPKALWAQVSGPLTRLPAKLGSQRGGITEVGVSRLTPLGLLLPPPLSAKSLAASTVTHAVVGLLDQRGNNDQQKPYRASQWVPVRPFISELR